MRSWGPRGAPRAGAPAALLALLVLAACGGGTTTVTEERTVTEREGASGAGADQGGEATGSGESGTGEAAGGEAEVGEPAGGEAPAELRELESFQSPSGNIGCVLVEGDARCDAAKHAWAAPRPDDCPPGSDSGQGLEVGASGDAGVVCAGDTTLSTSAPVLDYGSTAQGGDTVCVSRRSGVTCTNADGHGFTIGAQAYELF